VKYLKQESQFGCCGKNEGVRSPEAFQWSKRERILTGGVAAELERSERT
jgi:hypothetical protein